MKSISNFIKYTGILVLVTTYIFIAISFDGPPFGFERVPSTNSILS